MVDREAVASDEDVTAVQIIQLEDQAFRSNDEGSEIAIATMRPAQMTHWYDGAMSSVNCGFKIAFSQF